MKKIGGCLLFILLTYYLLEGGVTYTYALSALSIWFEKLVPSMFVSMVLVRLLYQMGILHLLAKPFGWLTKACFHIDSNAFSLVIASVFLGFPTSAILVDEEVQKGYLKAEDAKRLIQCCCFATPGFIILTCGTVLYQSVDIGWKLFLISLFSGILLLFLTRRHRIEQIEIKKSSSVSFFHSLSTAMLESGKALFMIGGYLMIVISITAILIPLLPSFVQMFVQVITEFSSGTIIIAQSSESLSWKLALTATLLSFGGLCVHLQILAMAVHSKLRYHEYLGYRIIQGAIAFGLAFLCF